MKWFFGESGGVATVLKTEDWIRLFPGDGLDHSSLRKQILLISTGSFSGETKILPHISLSLPKTEII